MLALRQGPRAFALVCLTAWTVALTAAPAGSAACTPPAGNSNVAVTAAAKFIKPTSAYLEGFVNSQGFDATWAFQWGITTGYGKITPGGATQNTSPAAVAEQITGLMPGATYHYRMVVLQGSYPCQTVQMGVDFKLATPTTSSSSGKSSPSTKNSGPPSGRASLVSSRIKVSRGVAAMSFRCSGVPGTLCLGAVSLSARGKRCGAGTLAATAGHSRTVRSRLSRGCAALLANASHRKLGASLVVRFTSVQSTLRKSVLLIG